jgi:hypothetical protein
LIGATACIQPGANEIGMNSPASSMIGSMKRLSVCDMPFSSRTVSASPCDSPEANSPVAAMSSSTSSSSTAPMRTPIAIATISTRIAWHTSTSTMAGRHAGLTA